MKNKQVLIGSILVVVIGIAGAIYFWPNQSHSKKAPVALASATPLPSPTATPNALPLNTPAPQTPRPTATPSAAPTPPPLNNSDASLTNDLANIPSGDELSSMLTNEEVIRKVVRAVYGLSQGRIVRQYRPITSPKGQFISQKIGQQTADSQQELYRIARENYARYENYVSLFAAINSDALITLYRFYLPTFETAYQELGIGKGDFHSTALKAIDVLLDAPSPQEAVLLIQPSVAYTFADPALEKLPQAHKLMLRMGQENSEALKLELEALKEKLEVM